jgi:hypothetical protein
VYNNVYFGAMKVWRVITFGEREKVKGWTGD